MISLNIYPFLNFKEELLLSSSRCYYKFSCVKYFFVIYIVFSYNNGKCSNVKSYDDNIDFKT